MEKISIDFDYVAVDTGYTQHISLIDLKENIFDEFISSIFMDHHYNEKDFEKYLPIKIMFERGDTFSRFEPRYPKNLNDEDKKIAESLANGVDLGGFRGIIVFKVVKVIKNGIKNFDISDVGKLRKALEETDYCYMNGETEIELYKMTDGKQCLFVSIESESG